MIGGEDEAAFARAEPVLRSMGETLIRTGAVGSAHAMKALNNLLSAIVLVGASEVLSIGSRFGLDPEVYLGILLQRAPREALRYRPNVVVATPEGTPPFMENDWLGRELTLGGVRLVGTLPTPRCSVPTLEHGDLPRSKEALRGPAERNRVDVPGFGVLPCAGLYARVEAPGTLRCGDPVSVG